MEQRKEKQDFEQPKVEYVPVEPVHTKSSRGQGKGQIKENNGHGKGQNK